MWLPHFTHGDISAHRENKKQIKKGLFTFWVIDWSENVLGSFYKILENLAFLNNSQHKTTRQIRIFRCWRGYMTPWSEETCRAEE